MMISIAGVLVAGSAAALVNTSVLDNSASPSPLEANGAQTQLTTPPVTVTMVSVAPAVTAPSAAPSVTTPTVVDTVAPVVAPALQAAYAIGEAGTVTLDTVGNVLTIVEVTPAEGWLVTKAETEDASNVEIKLQRGGVEVEFHANLQLGVVTPFVESKNDSTPDNSVEDDHGGRGGGGDDDSDD